MKTLLGVLLAFACAQAWAELPDAPSASKPGAFSTKPFGITALIAEREQTRRTKPSYADTTIGAGLSYRFADYKAVINVNYGFSLQLHTQGVVGSLSYRLWQFGPTRVASK